MTASIPTTYTIGDWSAVNNPDTMRADASGCWWRVTTETGWSGSAAPRTNSLPREQADGDFEGPVWESGRTIQLGGQVFAPDQVTLQQALDKVNRLLVSGNRFDNLIVAEAHLIRQCRVRRDGEKLASKWSPFYGTWSIGLYADDPVRYSAALHTVTSGLYVGAPGRMHPRVGLQVYGALGSQGLLAVTNAGDQTTYPTITLTASPTEPLVNPQLRLVGGSFLGLNLSIDPGHFITFDLQNERIVLDGVASRFLSQVSGSEFFSCPGNTTSQILFTADSGGAAQATVSWRDAYS